jgi:hypothetical protein
VSHDTNPWSSVAKTVAKLSFRCDILVYDLHASTKGGFTKVFVSFEFK